MGCARGIPCLSCSVLAAVSSDILSSSAAGAVPTYHSPAPTGFSCHLATPTVCISYNALTLSAPTAFNRELTESHRQREICRAAADDLSEFALAESSRSPAGTSRLTGLCSTGVASWFFASLSSGGGRALLSQQLVMMLSAVAGGSADWRPSRFVYFETRARPCVLDHDIRYAYMRMQV